jgi:hypothetical protein
MKHKMGSERAFPHRSYRNVRAERELLRTIRGRWDGGMTSTEGFADPPGVAGEVERQDTMAHKWKRGMKNAVCPLSFLLFSLFEILDCPPANPDFVSQALLG